MVYVHVGYGSVGVRCVHCITSTRYLCLDTPSVQVDQPPGEAPRHPLLFFPSNQSFLLITSVTKSDCFPPHPQKYRCHLCCRLLLSLVISPCFRIIHSHFFSTFFPLPISTNPNLPKLNGYLLTLVSILIFPGGDAMYSFFSMLNTHSPCPNAFRMVIRHLNPGCTRIPAH